MTDDDGARPGDQAGGRERHERNLFWITLSSYAVLSAGALAFLGLRARDNFDTLDAIALSLAVGAAAGGFRLPVLFRNAAALRHRAYRTTDRLRRGREGNAYDYLVSLRGREFDSLIRDLDEAGYPDLADDLDHAMVEAERQFGGSRQ